MERAAEPWLTTIDVEETAGDMRARDRRTAVAFAESGRDGHRGRDRVERIIPSDPVDDVARRRAFAGPVLGDIRLPDHDESIRLFVRERSKKRCVNKREECRGGRYAKSQQE